MTETREKWRYVPIVIAVVAVMLVACESKAADDGSPSEDETSAAPPWADEVPRGIDVVDKGHIFTKNGPNLETYESLGVLLENTTDRLMVLRVKFAVWDVNGDDPWWKSDKNQPIFVPIPPGERVGTGSAVAGTGSDADGSPTVAEIKVTATEYKKKKYDGEPVGFGETAIAQPDKAMTATPTKVGHPNKVIFTVNNPYSESVTAIGLGLVVLDLDGKVGGGWSFRPGEDVDANKTRFTPGEFPPGKSTHEITLGALGISADNAWEYDESSIRMFVWARS